MTKTAPRTRSRHVFGRYGFIMSALLVFAVGLFFSFNNMLEQKRLIEKESRINLWFLAQAEIEYLRLLEALALYGQPDTGLGKDELQLRFEIFWSRLPVLLEGPQTEVLREVPQFETTVRELLGVLQQAEPQIERLGVGDRAGAAALRGVLGPWRTRLHHVVLDALIYESTAVSTDRKNVEELYFELMVLFVGTAVGVVVLFLVLYRETRRAERAEREASTARAQLLEAIESVSEAFVLFDDRDRLVLHNTIYKEFHPEFADLVRPGVAFETLMRAVVERDPSIADARRAQWVADQVRRHRNPGDPFECQTDDGRWLRIGERLTKHGWVVGVHSDVTELKCRETDLAEESALLEATLQNIDQGICAVDAKLRLLTWNKVYVDMMCLPDKLVRPGMASVELIRHQARRGEYGPGDPEDHVREQLRIAESVARGGTKYRKVERSRPDGSTLAVTYNAMPGGGFVKTFTDITERVQAEKERAELSQRFHDAQQENLQLMMEHEAAQRRSAETRLADAIESTPEAVMLLDADENVVIANSQATRMLPSLTDMIRPGVSFAKIMEEASKRDIYAADSSTSRGGQGAVAGDGAAAVTEQNLNDGRWLRVSRSPTRDGGSVLIWTDITEIKQREVSLREAKEEAEAANASKTKFLTGMSHELRTPLNAIIGFSEIMSRELFGEVGRPQYREYASDILDSGRHLLDVINDILDFAKSEEGKLRLRPEPVEAAAVVESCRKIIHNECTEAGIALRVKLEPKLPVIDADAAKLRQILINILSNAVKFTRNGGKILVTVRPARGGGISIVVKDNGIGMHPADIPTALEPFGQIDSSIARRYEGTGLGLPLTKVLVELHGGLLEVSSEPDKGTTVTVRLPGKPPAQAAEDLGAGPGHAGGVSAA